MEKDNSQDLTKSAPEAGMVTQNLSEDSSPQKFRVPYFSFLFISLLALLIFLLNEFVFSTVSDKYSLSGVIIVIIFICLLGSLSLSRISFAKRFLIAILSVFVVGISYDLMTGQDALYIFFAFGSLWIYVVLHHIWELLWDKKSYLTLVLIGIVFLPLFSTLIPRLKQRGLDYLNSSNQIRSVNDQKNGVINDQINTLDWKTYTNDRLGFSIKLPSLIQGRHKDYVMAKITYFESPVDVFSDNNSNYVFIDTVFKDPSRKEKWTFGSIKNAKPLGTNRQPWTIFVVDVSNERDILTHVRKIISDIYQASAETCVIKKVNISSYPENMTHYTIRSHIPSGYFDPTCPLNVSSSKDEIVYSAQYKRMAMFTRDAGDLQYTYNDKVLDDLVTKSFKFIDKGSTDTSDWKTYRNEEYGFELKYPKLWLTEEKPGEYVQYQIFLFKVISPDRGEDLASYKKRLAEGCEGWCGAPDRYDFAVSFSDRVSTGLHSSRAVSSESDLLEYLTNSRGSIVADTLRIVDLNGSRGFEFSPLGDGGGPAKVIFIYKDGYIVELHSLYDEGKNVIEKILSTFKFTK